VQLSGQLESTRIVDIPYDLTRSLFTLVGFLQVLMLICILVISVFKPWGKRLSGQKEANISGDRAAVAA